MGRRDPRIVIVEDDGLTAADMRATLQRVGVTIVGIASSTTEALELIEHEQPDIVLLDISLDGGYEGLELAQEIQRRWGLPLIFISGRLGDDAVAGIDQLNVAGLLVKPFYPVNLRETVLAAIDALPD